MPESLEDLKKEVDDLLKGAEEDARESPEQKPSLDPLYNIAEQKIREQETHRKGWEYFYCLRNNWSWYLMIVIFLMFSFQVVLAIFIGLGIFNFDKYKYLLYIVVGENFLQIVGMAVVVVKYLFHNNYTDPKNT